MTGHGFKILAIGGLVAIMPYLCPFGGTSGGVGILQAAEKTPPPQPQELRITTTPVCPGQISPFQCGQFIEYNSDLVTGMWAEKLYDNNFGDWPLRGIVVETPWYPSGQTKRAVCSRDKTTTISGGASQKIKANGETPCTVGISQDGLAVDKSDPCNFSCYMKQQGLTGLVTVQVREGDKILATAEFKPVGDWQKFKARLVFSTSSTNATLSISFSGPGATLWLDSASLMPESAIGGWRRDVVEATRAMKPGIIRYGGTLVKCNWPWRDTLGDPDRRKPLVGWGRLQPSGAGIEEIIQFIQTVGAATLLCVNFNSKTQTLNDAVAQIEYFNGATNTPMGALRAANGHPKPYKIKYWQVGNEVGGQEYAELLPGYCAAMKRADPSISLLSSYPENQVVKLSQGYIDYICPHFYNPGALINPYFPGYRKMIQEYGNGKAIKVGVTEWNYLPGNDRGMLWGSLENELYCARFHNNMHRNCDLVEIANRSNLCNCNRGGLLQTDRARLYKTPAYYVQQLYSAHASNGKPLKIESTAGKKGEELDISAVLSDSQDKVFLFAVNATRDVLKKKLDLSAFGNKGQNLKIWVVADRDHAGDTAVANTFADPERICTRPGTYAAPAPQFAYEFPPLSFTVLEWVVQKGGTNE